MKKAICLLTAVCLVLCLFSGCKGSIDTDTIEMEVSSDEMLYYAPLIFLGKVTAEQSGHYRNPDLDKKAQDGNPIYNGWITPYTVEIAEVYKGDLRPDINELTISLFNFSPDDRKGNNTDVTVGDTLIFCATYVPEDESYGPLWGTNGCYKATDNENVFDNGQDKIDISEIKQRIKSAGQRTDLPPMGDFYIREQDKA